MGFNNFAVHQPIGEFLSRCECGQSLAADCRFCFFGLRIVRNTGLLNPFGVLRVCFAWYSLQVCRGLFNCYPSGVRFWCAGHAVPLTGARRKLSVPKKP